MKSGNREIVERGTGSDERGGVNGASAVPRSPIPVPRVWPGLDSYTEADATRFFGRDEEIALVSAKVAGEGFVTLFGPSGIGKTSLVLAGVLPVLRRKGYLGVYIRLAHDDAAKPYALQVKEAVLSAARAARLAVEETCSPIDPAAEETLWEWFHRRRFANALKRPVEPVVVIDQFEEVFTIGEAKARSEGWLAELADLAANSVPDALAAADAAAGAVFDSECQTWRIVASLREDFLANLEECAALHPVFREGRFAVGPLSREKALEVVEKGFGEAIAPGVAEAIVEAVGGRAGKIETPLLSLFCSQLEIMRREKALGQITPSLVAGASGDIVRRFYAGAMARISAASRDWLEARLLNENGYRMPVQIAVAEQNGVTGEEWRTLENERLLHVLVRDGEKWLELAHDILAPVAKASREERRIANEKARAAAKLARARRRSRIATCLFTALAAAVVVAGAAWWWFFQRPHVEYYRQFTKKHGIPVGVGPAIPMEEVSHREYSFRLVKKSLYEFRGWRIVPRGVSRVDAVNGRLEPTTAHSVVTYLWKGDNDTSQATSSIHDNRAIRSGKLKTVCTWEYSTTPEGLPERETAYDRDGRVVWIMPYTKTVVENACLKTAIAHFALDDGFPARQRSDEAEYVRISYGPDGFESLIEYLDRNGEPTPGPDGAYQIEYVHLPDGRLKRMASRGRDGAYMIDGAGNTGIEYEFIDSMREVHAQSFDTNGVAIAARSGVAFDVKAFDEWWNVKELRQYGIDRRAVTNGWASAAFERDNHGLLKRAIFRKARDPNADSKCVAEERTDYDEMGNPTNIASFAAKGEAACDSELGVHIQRMEFAGVGKPVKIEYFNENGNPMATGEGVARIEIQYDPATGSESSRDFYAPPGKGGVSGWPTVHRVFRKFDSLGGMLEECYFAADGSQTVNDNGIHRCEYEYDPETHAKTEARFYAPDGMGGIWGYTNMHQVVRTYAVHAGSGKKLLARDEYFDCFNQPAANGKGISLVEYMYDSHGVKRREDQYAIEGKGGIRGNPGLHHVVYIYNREGNTEMQLSLAEDGTFVVDNGGAVGRIEYYPGTGNSRIFDALSLPPVGLENDGVTARKIDYYAPGGILQRRVVTDFSGERTYYNFDSEGKPREKKPRKKEVEKFKPL